MSFTKPEEKTTSEDVRHNKYSDMKDFVERIEQMSDKEIDQLANFLVKLKAYRQDKYKLFV